MFRIWNISSVQRLLNLFLIQAVEPRLLVPRQCNDATQPLANQRLAGSEKNPVIGIAAARLWAIRATEISSANYRHPSGRRLHSLLLKSEMLDGLGFRILRGVFMHPAWRLILEFSHSPGPLHKEAWLL